SKRESVEIVAESVQFLGSRGDGGGEPQFVPAGAAAGSADFPASAADDDIPFLKEIRNGTNEKARRGAGEPPPPPGPPPGAQPRSRTRRFCRDKVEEIDYKNIPPLRPFISEKGKIRSRRITGACRRHQVQVGAAVKRAREMALLPYVSGN